MTPETASEIKPPRMGHGYVLFGNIVVALCLFLWDVVVCHSMYCHELAAMGVFLCVCFALINMLMRRFTMAIACGLAVLVYVVTCDAIFTARDATNRLAEKNAEPVIAALKQFKTEQGRFPGSLNELVPRYLQTIPRAASAWRHNHFWYEASHRGETARLYYWCLWPCTKAYFDFRYQMWDRYLLSDYD